MAGESGVGRTGRWAARRATREFRRVSLGAALLAVVLSSGILPSRAADPVAPQLRARVEKARPELGDLPAWQEEIFQNEVLPSSGRFIRDYKTSAGVVTKADVDLLGIKRYLSFTATQILKPESNKVLLFVRANAACTKCEKAISGIRTDLKTRLERRGLVVLLPTADELRREPTEAYSRRNASGWVLAEVRAEEDPEHAGDLRYALLLDFRFPGTLASAVQKQMEILSSDSIEVSMSRLSIDAILEIGTKARAGYANANVDGVPVDVAIEGVSDFPLLRQMKSKIQSALGTEYRLVEKRIEPGGRAVLAAYSVNIGDAAAAPVAEAVRKAVFDGFTVQVTHIGEGRIDLRVALAARTGGA